MILKNKISVVIQTYNQQEYITDCVDSVLEQNQDIIGEIIIIDDKSTDETVRLLTKKYAGNNKINLCINEENLGAFKTFRKVHNIARFEYVAHLDGDDIWNSSKLLKQYQILEADKSLIACGSSANILLNDGSLGKELFP